MPRFALDLELDGRGFAGTQWQPGQRTVQGEMAAAVAGLAGGGGRVRLCSRLDAGVDAEHLPGDVELGRAWDAATLARALTQRLPPDLAVRRAAPVDDAWDAIAAAVAKTYRYRVRLRDIRPVVDRRCLWVRRLDHPERLAACAALLPGRRDLSGFASLRHDGTDDGDPVRRIDAAAWIREDEGGDATFTFRITGSGFLYRQVRGLVGGMLAAATGRWDVAAFAACCAGGRGAPRHGNVAPAAGLCLERVRCEPEPAWALS